MNMNQWKPGKPVITEDDRAEWQAWKKRSILEAQRARRAMYPRIDYYPSKAALEVIRANTSAYVGGDYSSVINRIVQEWSELPELNMVV